MGTVTAIDSPPTKAQILFIDDEPRVLKSMRAMFRKHFDVYLANSGAEALEIIASTPIDVVVSDQRMPNMTGVEVLTEIKSRCPQAIRILLTGYADLEAIEASLNDAEVFRYLMKPSSSEEIRCAIEDGLGVRDEPHALAEVIMLQPTVNDEPATTEEPTQDASETPAAVPQATVAPSADILLLGDHELQNALEKAVKGTKVHCVSNLDEAATVCEQHAVGLLVLDVALDTMETLAEEAKTRLPHIVTLVASDRSDAMLLIQLINQGLVFRFLVKPVQEGRLKLTLQAAQERLGDLPNVPTAALSEAPSKWTCFVNWLLGR